MRGMTSAAIGVAALAIVGSACLRNGQAQAEGYGQNSGDPCASAPSSSSPFGMLVNVLVQQQRQAACTAQRRAQWDQYNAKQKAAKAAEDAAAAQKQAEQASASRAKDEARAAQAAASARIAQKKAQQREQARNEQRRLADQKRQQTLALLQAEQAPDNHCRDPHLARAVIDGWNGLDVMKASDIRTIDIEHVTTVSFQPQSMRFSCHGVFVTSKGWKIVGTVTVRRNIANQAMFVWERDRNQDLAVYEPPPVDASSPEMASQTKIVSGTSAVTQVDTLPAPR